MSLDSAKIADLRAKHLEMIQAVVLRMSNQAGSVKNYCITVTTAVCGFAITLQQPLLALLAVLPIAAFALVDAQYLRLERCFRALYERARGEPWDVLPTFELNLKSAPPERYWGTLLSWSISSFYVPLAAAVVIVVVVARFVYGKFI
jgi:histidine triad (HIT) family protein